jgi:hypothetical protein
VLWELIKFYFNGFCVHSEPLLKGTWVLIGPHSAPVTSQL